MKKCWAEKLGDCSGEITREHLISSSLYDQKIVSVTGLSWCKNKKCDIGLQNLTSKILCKHHNNSLSEVDIHGAKAFKTFEQVKHQMLIRKKMQQRRWTKTKYRIDGQLLERWFIKTGVNLIYYNPALLKDDNQSPDKELLEVIFGFGKLSKFAGLYVAFSDGQTFRNENSIEFSTLSDNDNAVIGFRFTFQGFRFLISLHTKQYTGIKEDNAQKEEGDWSNSTLIYHPENINIKQGKYISQIINFKW